MEEFVKLVLELRTLQKQFFKNHDRDTLQKCKEAEKKVDQFITGYLQKDIAVQKSMFE